MLMDYKYKLYRSLLFCENTPIITTNLNDAQLFYEQYDYFLDKHKKSIDRIYNTFNLDHHFSNYRYRDLK
jgi:hypothetical protein